MLDYLHGIRAIAGSQADRGCPIDNAAELDRVIADVERRGVFEFWDEMQSAPPPTAAFAAAAPMDEAFAAIAGVDQATWLRKVEEHKRKAQVQP